MKPCAVLFFSASPSVTGWVFQLGSQNSLSHDFISLISNTSKIMASSTTYNISCRVYKLLIFSIKRPKSPRPLTNINKKTKSPIPENTNSKITCDFGDDRTARKGHICEDS